MAADALSILTLVISTATCLVVIVVVIVLFLRRETTPGDISAAVTETWLRMGLGQAIGQIQAQAKELRDSYKTLEQMLRSPAGRASFGELSLEVLLTDQLPADYFGIREQCLPGRIPDAHIKAPEGLICIDSKFPLENYVKMCNCDGNASERKRFLDLFLKDSERHLKKVADEYIQPGAGTAAFALVYIPSEAVYYALVTEGYSLLKKYLGLGVQVVSPLLLGHKLELLKLGIRALRLNENAEEVLLTLQALAKRFERIDEAWRVFYTTHLRNLTSKADEIDVAYTKLQKEFREVFEDITPTRDAASNSHA